MTAGADKELGGVRGTAGVDVAIVGAGLAGLTAARDLLRKGVSVAVLEARDRVGGRTLSRHLQDGSVVELGGQWIGPGQDTRVPQLWVGSGRLDG